MLGFIVGAVVTCCVGWLIIKKYQPHTVLLLAGLLLLTLTVFIQPETSILFKKAKSTGWTGFDVFNYVKESLSYRAAGLGMIIMAAGGFAKYMDHIGATNTMVSVFIRPLKALRSPYLVLALGYAVGQILNIFIPSAAGLAMLLLVTFYPTLVRLGVNPKAAAAMIGTTAVLDLGPASGAANLAAKTAGLDVATYFASHQIPTAVLTIIVITVLTYFSAKYFDNKEGYEIDDIQKDVNAKEKDLNCPPVIYAILPVLPLTLILIFSKLLISSIKLHVVTAMIIGMFIGMLFEVFRTGDIKTVFKGVMAFFDGMGHMFARIVSLIVCAETFAAGLKTIGAVGFMTTSAENAGFSLTLMTLVMCTIVAAVAILTGSGNAAFFSFGNLAPDMAAKFGASAVSMLLPMQLTAGLARSMSPVAGVIIAVSDAGNCSPFDIVKRTAIPVVGGIFATWATSIFFI